MTDRGRGRLYEGERLVGVVDYELDEQQGRMTRATLRVVDPSPSHVFTEEINKTPPVKLTLHLANGRRWDCFLKDNELGSPLAIAFERGGG
jgi:hypothetical protein